MPTPTQIADKLFKKSLGIGNTDQGKPFFEEDPSIKGFTHVLPNQIWNQGDHIPNSSPFGFPDNTTMSTYDGSISGVVQYKHNLQLRNNPAMGSKSYFHEDLKDSIAFNFGDNTYNYSITTQGGSSIVFGQGDWIVDNDQGSLTFYGTVPSGVSQSTPPKISFYRYVGTKGLGIADVSGTSSSTFQLDNDASGVILANNDGNLEVQTIDGSLANINIGSLTIDNINGYLRAIDGSVITETGDILLGYEETIIGNDSSSMFLINHNLDTLSHTITVYDTSINDEIFPEKERGLNQDTLTFISAPNVGQNYNVVILGF